MIKYKKLVRDKIPDIIKKNGGECKTRVAKKDEFSALLAQKLLEEVDELIENPCAEEIADVLEVVEAIARINRINLDDIKAAKMKKKEERGGFMSRIVLETASEFKLRKGEEFIEPGYINDEEKPIIERDGSHVTLNMGNTETLHKDFKTSGDSLKK